jgi:hypothetical protein
VPRGTDIVQAAGNSPRRPAGRADGKLAEALRQLRAGELGDEYVFSDEDLGWARRELDPAEGEPS